MKKTAVSLVVIAAITLWVSMPCAYADSPWKSRVGSLRSGGGSFLGGRSSSSRAALSGLSRLSGRSGHSGLSGLSGLSGGGRNGSGLAELARGIGQLHGLNGNGQSYGSGIGNGRVLGEFLNNAGAYGHNGGYGGYGYREDQMAKAYRDVGIANAVVGLVGVLVTASQNANYPAVAVAPVSAPPAGHWERQTVVVQPAHYESYQEWIPEIFDSRTGQRIGGGFYESRTRLVPETLQYRDVWVGP